MLTAETAIITRHLLAESVRRCNHAPSEAYILACLAEKADAGFVGMFSRVGDLLEAAQALQREGIIGEISCSESRITGQPFFKATVSIR